jgi:putative tricarboxylic transport membrane protein
MADRVIAACTLMLAGLYFWGIFSIRVPLIEDSLGPRSFPMLIGAGLVIAAVLLLLESLRRPAASTATVAPDDTAEPKRNLRTVLSVAAATALYFVAFVPVGYVLSTAAYLSGMILWFYRGNRWLAVGVAIGFALVTYLLFTYGLRARLPRGPLPF